MSALAALTRAYDRLANRGEVPPFGYSREKIGFVISLENDGMPAAPPADLREGEGRKRIAPLLAVPQPVKRTSGVAPNFLWDKTAYVLGVTAGEGKRTEQEHADFIARHAEKLAGTTDAGLLALLRFLNWWNPDRFAELGWPEDMKDQNVVFALESERLDRVFLHDRPAARKLWTRLTAEGETNEAVCLVSGETGPVARLHPAIKGVWGGQSSGGSIVSFNLDAFTSYGHEQGDNSPVSQAAAFAYTTALNRFLDRDSGHRIQIGDASTVFWAEAPNVEAATEAETMFSSFMAVDEKAEARKVDSVLQSLREGRPTDFIVRELPKGVRFHVLGLAPNAARISLRFYLEDDFGVIAGRYLTHLERMRLDPPPREEAPSMWRMLIETATLRKAENIQPNLAGEWMRAILSGGPYPLTLLSTLLMRLRADGDVNALRVAMIKAVLMSNFEKTFKREVPVSLDKDFHETGYLLGRLFAVYEQIQSAALGRSVNATIKDKFFGSASSQPRKVFPMLSTGTAPHLSKIGKQRPGQRIVLDRIVAEIMDVMQPDKDPFPAHLPDRQQGLFALGYYHQRNDFFRKRDKGDADHDSTTGTGEDIQ